MTQTKLRFKSCPLSIWQSSRRHEACSQKRWERQWVRGRRKKRPRNQNKNKVFRDFPLQLCGLGAWGAGGYVALLQSDSDRWLDQGQHYTKGNSLTNRQIQCHLRMIHFRFKPSPQLEAAALPECEPHWLLKWKQLTTILKRACCVWKAAMLRKTNTLRWVQENERLRKFGTDNEIL